MAAEEADDGLGLPDFARAGIPARSAAFHVELMAQRGLVVGAARYDGLTGEPVETCVERVTWEGYDYLDAIRSPQVWSRAKEAIASAVGDTSLSVVKEVCQLIAASLVRQNLGL